MLTWLDKGIAGSMQRRMGSTKAFHPGVPVTSEKLSDQKGQIDAPGAPYCFLPRTPNPIINAATLSISGSPLPSRRTKS
jgi:hypothetical protein